MVSYAAPFIGGYGAPLCAPEEVEIIRISGDVLTPDDFSDDALGFGVWMKGLETGMTHWFHHTQVLLPVNVGQTVKRGQIVAFMGNSGEVYSGGVPVPADPKVRYNPNYPGVHLHWEMNEKGYRLGGPKRLLDPRAHIDWTLQPTYTTGDLLKAYSVVVGKAAGLIAKQ
jgi:hypothetical protein